MHAFKSISTSVEILWFSMKLEKCTCHNITHSLMVGELPNAFISHFNYRRYNIR